MLSAHSGRTRAIRLGVVFATDFDGTSPGGITTAVWRIIACLGGEFRVSLVCVADASGVREIRGRFDRRNLEVFPVLPSSRRARWIPLNVVFTAALFLKRRKILQGVDLIHAHRMESALPFVIPRTKPVVLTVHGSSKDHALCRTGLLRWRIVQRVYEIVEGFVLSRVDRVQMVSEEAFDYYGRRHPHLRHKFVMIPPFLEDAAFQPVDRAKARSFYGVGESDLAVVFVGRLHQQKRVDLLIDAFAELVRERPSARLFIAGAGPEEDGLRRQAAGLGSRRVRFLGMLSMSAVRVLLSCGDVMVLPSLWEGLPMVIVEALACGVPVVATDVGGVREVLAGDLEDFIVSSGEPTEIMRKILDAAERREALRGICVEHARRFGAAQVLPRLERAYAELVHAGG